MLSLATAVVIVAVTTTLLVGLLLAYFRTGVPTVVSSKIAQKQVADYLARQKDIEKIYELGSGKGDFVMRLAKRLPRANIYGFELSPAPYLFSKIWKRFSSVGKRVSFYLADFRKIDLSSADAVVFYLMPHMNKRLAPKLLKELRSGSLVITVSFSMQGWKPEKTLVANTISKTRTFIYRIV